MKAYITGSAERLGKRMEASAFDLHLAVGREAIRDAGLMPSAIDGVLTGLPVSEPYPSFSIVVGEALGTTPLAHSQVMQLGGASPGAMVGHAARLVSEGHCKAVLVIYADNRLTAMSRDSFIERATDAIHPSFERPVGPTIAALYALAAARHMGVYGSRPEDFAPVAVTGRANALRTPGAVMSKPITVDDVLASKMIATPLRMLDCCLFTDFAGAVVVTSAELTSYSGHRPVEVLGAADRHSHAHLTQCADLLDPAIRLGGDAVFAQAGVTREDIDCVQLYDCFTIAVALQLEGLGFCAPGESPGFIAERYNRPGGLPANTNGGMLSFHNGGIYHLTEAVYQLRGDAGERQVEGAELALVQGNGGVFAHHSTLILARGAAS